MSATLLKYNINYNYFFLNLAIKYLLEELEKILQKVNKFYNKKLGDLKEYFEKNFCPLLDCTIMIEKDTSKINNFLYNFL